MKFERTYIIPARDVRSYSNPKEALDRVKELYDQAIGVLRKEFDLFIDNGGSETLVKEACYPYIYIMVEGEPKYIDPRESYGFVRKPGMYGTTVTRPDLFEDYYSNQFTRLLQNHNGPLFVGISDQPIPIHFAFGDSDEQLGQRLTKDLAEMLPYCFAVPDLSLIDDSIANGTRKFPSSMPLPLSLFTAERVDLSLQRLKHYTGTSPKHFQKFVLFTNYQFYIDEFVKLGLETMTECHSELCKGIQADFSAFVLPGEYEITAEQAVKTKKIAMPERMPQMPAYHLKRPDGLGITMINIGIGPSNAKTMTDHLAVLRPHCWLMLGHCAGLRRSQSLGDYVLAHGYVREDHVLDADLPLWIPVPPLSEVQLALEQAVAEVTGLEGYEVKNIMRTGTVVTTDNRNWEMQDFYSAAQRYSLARAIAVDMESATIAANGLRFRVPYGTLLCVSDKPIHGQLKLPGMADKFYRQRVHQHLAIGLRGLTLLREGGLDRLHSRKLRTVDEPAFR